jgi:cytochrome o ubiquinol oxidase operon protein cyoD
MKTFRAYSMGYGLSVVLTLVAFGLLFYHLRSEHVFPPHEAMVPVLIALAVLQLFVQLVFFLHVGQEEKPRWNSVAFMFAVFVVVVIVGGTLWIMNNLEHPDITSLRNGYGAGGPVTPQTLDD